VIVKAGAVVFRSDGAAPRVLLVRSRKDPKGWVFPKGRVEKGERASQTALRETYEESGVTGELLDELGEPLNLRSGKRKVSVRYFLVRRRDEVDSPEGREKRWLDPSQAMRLLGNDESRKLLRLAIEELEGRTDTKTAGGSARSKAASSIARLAHHGLKRVAKAFAEFRPGPARKRKR
jgi:8-oxo-dGTP pyrophosphatase MutT (NUDIX family)